MLIIAETLNYENIGHSSNLSSYSIMSCQAKRRKLEWLNLIPVLSSHLNNTLFFSYKNLVYKNIKASNGPKIKNILRTYKGFKS